MRKHEKHELQEKWQKVNVFVYLLPLSADWFYFDARFFKRFLHVLKVLFPKWCSVNVLLFLFLLCVLLLQQVVVYHVGLIPSTYYIVLGEKDLPGFYSHTMYSLIITIAVAFLYATESYVTSVFYVTSRRHLSRYLHEKYFQDIFYYQLNVLDDVIDNPDQRITQDGERLCKSFSEIIAKLLISPFVICYYTYITWKSTGYIGPVSVVIFFIISTVINKFLMSPVVALVYKQEQLEGDFRFKHMQIRANAESAAFYRCGHLERQKTNKRLEALIQTQNRLLLKEYGLNFSIKLADYMGSILNYIILAFPIFAGVYDHLSPSELSALISENAFVTIYLIYSFTSLIDLAINVTDLAGVTHRVGQMMEQLGEWSCHGDRLQDTVYEGHISSVFNSAGDSSEPEVAYRVTNLTCSPPNSHDKVLIRDLSFEIKAKCNILITGDSGCGKSSLLRVLDGLWQQRSGSIERNVIHGHRGVLYLPQKPFLTDGSLREQIVYPYKDWKYTGVEDSVIMEYLRLADLMKLYHRIGGLDIVADWNWYDMLSPGEMQRLSFVRLFYHQPPFAVLDEATSQVSLDMERILYEQCEKLGITVASVGHRDSLRAYHHVEIHLDGQGGWCIKELINDQTYM